MRLHWDHETAFCLETAFSFCHFLFCFVLKSSNFITMLIINMPLFPMSAAELGKAIWCVSVETSSGWKLITFGGGVGYGGCSFSAESGPWTGSLSSHPSVSTSSQGGDWNMQPWSRELQLPASGLAQIAVEWCHLKKSTVLGLILICVEIFFFK